MNDFRTRPQTLNPDPNTPSPAPDADAPPSLTSLACDDGIHHALAAAVDRRLTVVVALVEGTRINGVPLAFSPPGPLAPADLGRRGSAEGTAVLIQQETGQTPFVVRLAHVVYVRVLTGRD